MIHKSKKLKSFTLVEVLVSLFLFVVITGILTQIYIATVRSERIAYVLLRDENIIRNELEVLARDIRMGKSFSSNGSGDSLDYLTYYDNSWHRISYVFDAEHNTIRKSVSDDIEYVSNDYVIIIPENIKIDTLKFYVNKLYNEQPSITITLTIESQAYNKKYTTSLQTTVTPRMLDL
ncbi:MAG TPA: prepilin-type N-terminal cleavage/methylation domain-containing protein [Candidatus Paceibacterota bacterium]|nr:prepilin-type N-terminal cleavage/methylation domain-containing protein [Candidatus Paceibacterota bacterium]